MIPVLKPKATGTEIEKLKEVIDSGWWGLGPKVEELEKAWAKFTGAKYAVAVNSCTAALQIACRIVKLPNPVRVSAFTFVSSALAPFMEGYDIKFVDIDPKTLCTKKSDVQVMYAGNISGKGKINDMAHASGYKHLGTVSCWSFHAVKNLPAGDGGMITTNSKKVYERAKALAWCGINKSTFQRNKDRYSWDYDIQEPGYKYHMNDLTAVIALEQLKLLKPRNQYRKLLAQTYDKYLPKWIERPYRSSSWHLYTIRIPDRDSLYDYLQSHGIGCGVHYKPLYYYAFFKNKGPLPHTEKAFQEIITLPLHMEITVEDVKDICAKINEFFKDRYGLI